MQTVDELTLFLLFQVVIDEDILRMCPFFKSSCHIRHDIENSVNNTATIGLYKEQVSHGLRDQNFITGSLFAQSASKIYVACVK